MIIQNIPAEITRIKKSSKDEIKLFIVITFTAAALPFIFGFLFFYIEQCYDPQPVPLTASEVKHGQLCSELRKQLQAPLAGDSSTINGTSMKSLNNSNFNNSTNTNISNSNNNTASNNNNHTSNNNNSNNHSFDISVLVKQFCNPPAKPIRSSNSCKLDIENLAQWISYTSSVTYTFGKNTKNKYFRLKRGSSCAFFKESIA